MKPKKKNKLFTFLFSLIPGAAEMYMGFMRNGISMMALFFLSIFIAVTLNQEPLLFASALVWFYSFFHARNLAACEEEILRNLEDDFIWTSFVIEKNIQISNPVLQKWVAGILIVFGAVMLWENFSQIIYRLIPDSLWDVLAPVVDRLPEVVISILIIYIGLQMIRGKKEELLDGNNQ